MLQNNNPTENTNSQSDLLSQLAQLEPALHKVDLSHVQKLVEKRGLYGAANILGYDTSSYDNLFMAGRLAMEDLRSKVPPTLLQYAHVMQKRLNPITFNFILTHHEKLQAAIEKNKHYDYDNDWFSGNTIITTYAASPKFGLPPAETPQYIWMRCAIQMYHQDGVDAVITCYEELAEGWYTPASPTLFNAGMAQPQMSSCFLLTIEDDLKSMYKHGIYRGAMISASSGGLGYNLSNIRHSEIGNKGMSDGIVPYCKEINEMIKHVNQGGRRKGASTLFLEPHHLDIENFVVLTSKKGDPNARARDVNTCIWESWIFNDRVENDEMWTLFCPASVKHLNNLWGKEFADAYIAAEQDPTIPAHHKKVVRARDLFHKIVQMQKESGMPYLMNGDACNMKSNHRRQGRKIQSSNLCLEIVEYTDGETIAVCNLHSLSLRMYALGAIDRTLASEPALRSAINFEQLAHMSRRVITNLNNVIDNNWYPLDKIRKDGSLKPGIINKSNKAQRPVGMGVSGLAEMLHILDLPFEDPITRIANKMIFACMYWNALAQSVQLAILKGVCEYHIGSPASEGKLQFDLWREEFLYRGPNDFRKYEDDEPLDPSVWGQKAVELVNEQGEVIDVILPTQEDLKRCIVKYGLHNSLLIALMPTASTAQMRRNCETVEAHQNNLYSRKVLKCSYPVLNRYLEADLQVLGVWNNNCVEYIKVKNGSVQGLTQYVKANSALFPDYNGDDARMAHIENKYKTMWELPQRLFIDLAADRGRYICQSASLNLYFENPDDVKIKSAHRYSEKKGLKTKMYYLRQSGAEVIKFTANANTLKYIKDFGVAAVTDEGTEECSSASCVMCKN
jgi:ribonucleoside-diphosphate reductase alpha chain